MSDHAQEIPVHPLDLALNVPAGCILVYSLTEQGKPDYFGSSLQHGNSSVQGVAGVHTLPVDQAQQMVFVA